VSAYYSDYFNRDQIKCNALHIFERRSTRISMLFIEVATRVEPRLQSKYGPSAGLDTHKLLQVPGRSVGREMERGGTRSMKERRKGRDGGIDGTRGPELPRVAKRLKVPFM